MKMHACVGFARTQCSRLRQEHALRSNFLQHFLIVQGISVWANISKNAGSHHTTPQKAHQETSCTPSNCQHCHVLLPLSSPEECYKPWRCLLYGRLYTFPGDTFPPPHAYDVHALPGSGFSIEGETSHQASLPKGATSKYTKVSAGHH